MKFGRNLVLSIRNRKTTKAARKLCAEIANQLESGELKWAAGDLKTTKNSFCALGLIQKAASLESTVGEPVYPVGVAISLGNYKGDDYDYGAYYNFEYCDISALEDKLPVALAAERLLARAMGFKVQNVANDDLETLIIHKNDQIDYTDPDVPTVQSTESMIGYFRKASKL